MSKTIEESFEETIDYLEKYRNSLVRTKYRLKYKYNKTTTFNREKLITGLTNRKLPTYFRDRYLDIAETDLNEWDWLSREVIKLGSFDKGWDFLRKRKYVNQVLLTGRSGNGKTSGGLDFAQVKSLNYSVPFQIANIFGGRVVILTPALILEELPYKEYEDLIIFIDEVQHCFHRMRSQSEANVDANQFFDTVRKLGINTVMTTPFMDQVDRSIVEDKVNWWIHCHRNDEIKQEVHAIVYFNATSECGKRSDFIEVERMILKWVDTEFYNKAKDKISKSIYSRDSLKEYKHEKRKVTKITNRESMNEKIQEIMSKDIGIGRKCFKLLELDIPVSTIQQICGLSYAKVMNVKSQMTMGKKINEIKLKKRKGKTNASN